MKRRLKSSQTPGPTIGEFEALEFDPERFDHEAHVFVAWSYLSQFDLLESISRYRKTLRRLTAMLGVPGKYHETITWFYMIAVAEHAEASKVTDWASFKSASPELFRRNPGIISDYYSRSRLMSEMARKKFILPDLKQCVRTLN